MLSNWGVACTGLGEFEAGRRYLQRSVDLAVEVRNPACAGNSRMNIADIDIRVGSPRRAIADLQALECDALERGARSLAATARGNLGLAQWAVGDIDEARTSLTDAVLLAGAIGHDLAAGSFLLSLSELEIEVGRPTQAKRNLELAERHLERTGHGLEQQRAASLRSQLEPLLDVL